MPSPNRKRPASVQWYMNRRFDAKLEPAFSRLVVKDSSGRKISGNSKVDPESSQSLEADLPVLAPGDYHVYWKVVAWDGHHSEGDYTFTFKP